jgi:hypothetical protein
MTVRAAARTAAERQVSQTLNQPPLRSPLSVRASSSPLLSTPNRRHLGRGLEDGGGAHRARQAPDPGEEPVDGREARARRSERGAPPPSPLSRVVSGNPSCASRAPRPCAHTPSARRDPLGLRRLATCRGAVKDARGRGAPRWRPGGSEPSAAAAAAVFRKSRRKKRPPSHPAPPIAVALSPTKPSPPKKHHRTRTR